MIRFRSYLIPGLIFGLVLVLAAPGAQAQKTLSGTISVDTTLDNVGGSVYEVTGAVTVNAGVTLTIDPGVALKFNQSTYMNIYGILDAQGGSSPDSLIIFTSIKDDTAPLHTPEDTNGDGAATTPAVGDWYYLNFIAADNASIMTFCKVLYTGQGNNAAVHFSGTSPTMDQCDLDYGYQGLRLTAGTGVAVSNTSINHMTTYPVSMQIFADPDLTNIILDSPSGNGMDGIHLSDGAVQGTDSIKRVSATIGGVAHPSLSYVVADHIDIGAGESLDIEPGVVLKFDGAYIVNNYGLLTALGGATADSLIYFTSIHDDNAPAPLGQDTNINGNSTFPQWNNWRGIRFFDSADDASVLRNCQILFAGFDGASYGAVYCENASPSLYDCDLTAAYYGVMCRGVSTPLLSNSSINAMQDVPIAIDISSDPVFDNLVFESTSDNGFDAIGILGGNLTGANTLRIRGAQLGATPIDNLVYILLSDITVDVGGNLTIDPGIVAKPRANVDLFVDGTLTMNGTADPDSQIVFTSYKDDTFGNPSDTNNDGSITAPAKGDWGKIRFNPGSAGSVSYATVKYGGYFQGALISVDSANPTLSELTLSDSYYGIEQAGTAASVITNVDIANTTFTPMLMSISANPVYSGITFTNVGLTAIGLIPETVGVDSVLRVRSMGGFDNITYYLSGDITVATGAHFRIEPGIVLKFNTGGLGYDLEIEGSLQAVGTPDSTIAFTGILDDSRGNPGDTAGDGANSPAASQWGQIHFAPTSVDGSCQVQYCELAYGGYGYTSEPDAVIWCDSASPTIRDNFFTTNHIGIWTAGNSAPLIQDNDFFNHSQTPLATSVQAAPNYVGNTFNQNGIHAVGLINETTTANAVLEKITNMGLPSYPYYNLGTTTVGSGTVLTVQPGVIVKARSNSNIFEVNGGILLTGTAPDRIILTSIKDDSYGGDSNVDGAGSSPVAGDWYGMVFNDAADDPNCLVEHCLFRFAGTSYVIRMNSASPTIRNNEFELCRYGHELRNTSNPTIQNNLFRVFTWYPLIKSVIAQPTFGGNVLDNVNYPCIGIIGESIGQDMTLGKWDFAGYTNITQALVGSTLTVQLGATLTIEPGVVFKMRYQASYPFYNQIHVYGALVADGTPTEPIIFTSTRDDAVGNPGDTNGDGSSTSPAVGNWAYIYFDEVSDDLTTILDHCELRYGYSPTGTYGMVRCNSASPTISNCDLQFAGHGISVRGASNPVIADCVFDNMTSTPVLMSLVSDPLFSGNQFLAGNGYNALGVIGETLAQDATFLSRNVAQTARIPYLLMGNLTAGFSSILRVEPGVTIKGGGANITIQRGLVAEGGSSPDSLIVFTAITDDFYGGDTNNDGDATAPDYDRWGRIFIQNEAIDDSTRFHNVVFRYGFNSSSNGTIEINSANPEFSNCTFAYNGVAVDYKGTAGDPAEGWIHDSDFLSNTYYAVRNQGSAFTVDATGNWWGHATGPLDSSDDTGSGGFYNPGGLGDAVSDLVDYGSWQTSGIQNLLLGDVSRNGDVRAYDGSLVLQEMVAPGLLGPLQLVLADVDCSGGPTAMDASLILRYVAGIDTYFPCALDSVATKRLPTDDPPVGSAPITFQVGVPEVDLAAGASTWVPVQLTGSGDLYGQEYHVRFDPEVVAVTDVRLLPQAAGSAMAWNVLNGNELRIAIASIQPLAVVDAVEFRVQATDGHEGGPVPLDLVFARLNNDVYDVSGTDDTPGAAVLVLHQNRPNPFNPSTLIAYEIPGPNPVPVEMSIYDAKGRLIRALVDEVQSPGPHEATWDGRDRTGRRVGSGIYLYLVRAGDESMIRKMVLLK